MNWYQIVLLVCLLLISGGFASWAFQSLKKWAPTNDAVRQVVVWVFCVVIGLATSFIQGDLLNFLGSWRSGTMTAADVLAYGSIIWGLAQGAYNLYWKPKAAAVLSLGK